MLVALDINHTRPLVWSLLFVCFCLWLFQKLTRELQKTVNLTDFPDCHPLTPWNPVGNSHAVDELVVQPGQALPLFIVKLKPLPMENKPRVIAVDYEDTSSVLEVESHTIDSVDYLIAALQHHLKTADPLCVEYFEEMTQSYSSLTDVSVLNQGDLTKHKLRVSKVPCFVCFCSFGESFDNTTLQ